MPSRRLNTSCVVSLSSPSMSSTIACTFSTASIRLLPVVVVHVTGHHKPKSSLASSTIFPDGVVRVVILVETWKDRSCGCIVTCRVSRRLLVLCQPFLGAICMDTGIAISEASMLSSVTNCVIVCVSRAIIIFSL